MFQPLPLFQTSIHPSYHHHDCHSLLHNWTTSLHVSTRNTRVSLLEEISEKNFFCFSDDSEIHCGLSSRASNEWKRYFYELHFGLNHFTIRCLFSELIPTGAVILFNSYIIFHLIRTHRRLHQQPHREHSRTTSWMNIVLLLHALLFLGSLLSHIVGHFTVTEAHEAWWVLLAILINSSINFYLYCLSGKAFRNEIYRMIQKLKIHFFRKLDIREDRCCRNDESDIIDVVIPLRRQHINDFHQHFLRR